ncbi:diaminopimelate epimerase [Sphingomonas sp. ID0503]|uniref:diaminopimelate epimerase n=1 Tax=Sphingomonas sp. ID0503 TaxID=3399691 RepID=UPI003AFA640C
MSIRFHKMHGLGNDFVVIDARVAAVAVDSAAARAIADRHTGVGCDQLILIGASDAADVSMRIWNADGSEVDACGNATRCVGALVGRDCTIETKAGILRASPDGNGATVDMGAPRFDWDAIPLAQPMDTMALPVGWEELEAPAAANMGNPHVVFFVENVDAIDLERLGPLIENDPLFPERTNVNIATILAPDHIRMRTWERGAGLTRACGTGACAVFATARRTRRIPGGRTRIDLPGGRLDMAMSAEGHVMMSGPATHVFTGELDESLLT